MTIEAQFNMNDWITGIVALLGGIGGLSGFCSIFLFYRENKRTKQLDNEHKANTEWQGLVVQYKKENDELKKRMDDREKEFNEALKRKDEKIDNLYRDNHELMKRNDKLSSKCAVQAILRCKVVGCASRVPPIGSREIPDVASAPGEEQDVTNKQE